MTYAPALVERFNRGIALKAAGQREAAAACYRWVLQRQPDIVEAWNNLANLYGDLDRLDESVSCYRCAIALRPEYAAALYNMAGILHRLERWIEADNAFHQSLILEPRFVEAHLNYGLLLKDMGQLEMAEAAFRRALALRPDFVDAASNLGLLLTLRHRFGEAEAALRYSLSRRATHSETWSNLGNLLKDMGRTEEALVCYQQALHRNPHNSAAASNRLLAGQYRFPPPDPAQGLAEHRAWETHLLPATRLRPPAAYTNIPEPGRPLRVGYVSADFGQHPVSAFLESVLTQHDRNQFIVHAYSDRLHEDTVTARLKTQIAVWRRCVGWSHAALAARIREDGIDILVDLAGHTADNRLEVFAGKPAPVQISWIGYPDTTGLSTIDYRITDPYTDPEGQDRFHSETLVRLGVGFLCYAPPMEAPSVALPAPCARSSGDNGVCFGSFNTYPKLSEAVIATWSRLLHARTDAHLLLKNKAMADEALRRHLLGRFAAHGIPPARLTLIAWSRSFAEHLALYANIDVALDSFPYNGTTTTCEALWMGVPVVTLAGDRHASRVGVSLLRGTGLEALGVAENVESYCAKALALVANPAALTALRAGLRDRLRAAPLCDAPRFTRNLEAAYRMMWQRWCTTQCQST